MPMTDYEISQTWSHEHVIVYLF